MTALNNSSELVLRMSPKVLLDTTPEGLAPLESRWQDELCQSFRKISTRTMGLGVGREFKQRAFLDVYINDLQWGVKKVTDRGLTNMWGGSSLVGDTIKS